MVDNMSLHAFCPPASLTRGDRVLFQEDDVLTANLHKIFTDADVVIHLAAITDAAGSYANDAEVFRVNVVGTQKVADACLQTGAALVFVSTTSVYGTRSDTVDEDCPDAELQPQSPYAASKLGAERMLRSLALHRGLRHVVCRFGTIFGPSPGMKFHTAISKFCRQAVAGVPITVWRTALMQQRPCLELGDAVDALIFILQRNLFSGQVLNVLTLNTSVSRIVEEIRVHVPELRVEHVDSPAMNRLSFRVGNDRIAGLGFHPRGTLGQGIGETIEALRSAEVGAMKHPAGLET